MEYGSAARKTRRLMCLVLVLALVLMCGVCSMAYAQILDDFSEIWSEDVTITKDVKIEDATVTVTADITLTIPAGLTLTVDGGIDASGKTLTVQGEGTLKVIGMEGDPGRAG